MNRVAELVVVLACVASAQGCLMSSSGDDSSSDSVPDGTDSDPGSGAAWVPDWDANATWIADRCDSFNRTQHANASCTIDHASWEALLTPRYIADINDSSVLVPVKMCGQAMLDLTGVDSSETCLASPRAEAAECRSHLAAISEITCQGAPGDHSKLVLDETHLTIHPGKLNYGSGPWVFEEAIRLIPSCGAACPRY